jgi:hypothetical protein
VAPPPQIKEKYGNDGLMKRVTVTASSKERGSEREDINPLAVYKTPFGDGRDGSFENMLRINSYSPEAVPSHFAMPPSYYEKTSQPINLRPVSSVFNFYLWLTAFIIAEHGGQIT